MKSFVAVAMVGSLSVFAFACGAASEDEVEENAAAARGAAASVDVGLEVSVCSAQAPRACRKLENGVWVYKCHNVASAPGVLTLASGNIPYQITSALPICSNNIALSSAGTVTVGGGAASGE